MPFVKEKHENKNVCYLQLITFQRSVLHRQHMQQHFFETLGFSSTFILPCKAELLDGQRQVEYPHLKAFL